MTTMLNRPDPQFQVITLVGHLTNQPELRSVDSGAVVRLASQSSADAARTAKTAASFLDVTAFGSQAENCAEYPTKGRRVGIVGRLHHSEWDTDYGRRKKLEVIVDTVDFLDAPRADAAENLAVEAAT